MFGKTLAHLVLGVALMVVGACPASADSLEGVVVSVTDGDTITVLEGGRIQHKVRISSIDAPEKGQAFGARAQQALAKTVFRKLVTVEWSKRDRYGRLVAKILIQGRDVGLEMVLAGLAWHYKLYELEQTATDRQLYSSTELDARQRRAGLWSQPAPIPPWDFRGHR